MQRVARTIDMTARLDALRQRHAEADEELKSYENRHFLTADEESTVRRLKKLKLQAKDEITRIEQAGNA